MTVSANTEMQEIRTDSLRHRPDLQRRVAAILGSDDEPLEVVVARAASQFPGTPVVVWEADPLTFSFTYVSPSAERLLGFPPARWVEPNFWKDTLVHPDDQADAISHCAMATAAGMDHDFEYRARTAAGEVVRLHDVVHVLKGPLGFASCLRGVMFPVSP